MKSILADKILSTESSSVHQIFEAKNSKSPLARMVVPM